MRHFLAIAVLAMLCGCSGAPPASAPSCAGSAQQCASSDGAWWAAPTERTAEESDAPTDPAGDAPMPNVIPAAMAQGQAQATAEPTAQSDLDRSNLLRLTSGDPLLSLLGDLYIADLLSIIVDGHFLDAFAPGEAAPEFTFLELLCRDGDIPDFVCRQRYGE